MNEQLHLEAPLSLFALASTPFSPFFLYPSQRFFVDVD